MKAHYQPACGALTVFDAEAGHGWYWSSDAKALPSWERAASIRQILHWWLPQFGVYEVHGGAIGTDAGGVLIVGKGGSGKSTTALSSLTVPGMRYAADDYVAIRVEPSPYAYSLYSSGKLEPCARRAVAALADAADNVDSLHVDDKAVFYVQELFPESSSTGFPLRAVMLPTICDRKETRLVPVPPTLALPPSPRARSSSSTRRCRTAGRRWPSSCGRSTASASSSARTFPPSRATILAYLEGATV